jgi:hypothetical protein
MKDRLSNGIYAPTTPDDAPGEDSVDGLLDADDIKRMLQAITLLSECAPTVRQVIEAGDKAIDAAGLNPWCMNEGCADGTETISLWWLENLEDKLTRTHRYRRTSSAGTGDESAGPNLSQP